MSFSEPTKNEVKRSVYDVCDPQYLRESREAAGMDLVVLARTACLSVAQVRQLETDDSDGLFYSDAIKRQAYKRLLMILGAEPPLVEVPEDLRDANQVAEAHLNTLDQIVAMSHQPVMNRTTSHVLGAVTDAVKAHQQVMAALLLLAVAVVLFVWHGPLRPTEATAVASAAVASEAVAVAMPSPGVASVAAPAPAPAVPASVSAAVASSPAVVASMATASQAFSCMYSTDAMPQLTPFVAHKEGRYVYLMSTSHAEVCVVDGNKQATTLQLKAGESRSVYGVSPWQISSPQLQKIQIYFQGGRVTLPEATHHVKLLEVAVSR